MNRNYIFTSESVTEGHPDKVCDKISDSILDAILNQDTEARVACETMITQGQAIISGEITTIADVDYETIVSNALKDIGYTTEELGATNTINKNKHFSIKHNIVSQSSHIAQGVDSSDDHEQGAGDQGLMFGYACNETPELMPLPIQLAQKLSHRLAKLRKNETLAWLKPDGKSQVSIRYEDDKPKAIEAIVLSTQHSPEVTNEEITSQLIEHVIKPVCGDLWNENIKIHVNPTGKFEIGGPHGDAGLTGRKIIVDSYGGMGRHGGGAFSGKDPSKVDRSACYMCRYVAKNIVAAGLADRCEVQVAYAIGVAEPVSLMVNTFGTNKISEEKIEELVNNNFDMRPAGIVSQLDLKRPIYKKTAAYGHFGRNEPEFNWEKTDKAQKLKEESGI